jgi:hypothetical protein
MKPSQLIVALVSLLKAGIVPIVHGAPGVGKTDIITEAVRRLSSDLLICHPVIDEPIDYKGLPGIVDGHARFLPYGNLQCMLDAKKMLIVFADDIGQAMQSVQAAWMQLLLARTINGIVISDNVRFVAATNRAEDRAGVQRMLTPLANRAVHLDLEVNNDDWQSWASARGIALEIRSYLRWKPASLLVFDGATAQSERAFPSPRSWSMLSTAIKDMPDELILDISKGTVGAGCGTEFASFCKIMRSMPQDPKLVLTDPDSVQVPTDQATCFAICGAVSALAKDSDKNGWDNIAKYALRMSEQHGALIFRESIAAIGTSGRNGHAFLQTQHGLKWLAEHKDAILGMTTK